MLWLFFLLIAVIAVLSYFDEITTQLDIRKFGLKAEENVVVKELEKEGGERLVFIYKLISVIGFAFIGWYIYNMGEIYFYGLAGLIIVIFIAVIIHNLEIFEKKES